MTDDRSIERKSSTLGVLRGFEDFLLFEFSLRQKKIVREQFAKMFARSHFQLSVEDKICAPDKKCIKSLSSGMSGFRD